MSNNFLNSIVKMYKQAQVKKSAMIIDEILDRKDGAGYDPKEFYDYVSHSLGTLNAEDIASALDSGTEADVKKALCEYVKLGEYNPAICDYINSVNWLEKEGNSKKAEENDGYITVWLWPSAGYLLNGFATQASSEQEALDNVAQYLGDNNMGKYYETEEEHYNRFKEDNPELSDEEISEMEHNDPTSIYVDNSMGFIGWINSENMRFSDGIDEKHIDQITIIDGPRKNASKQPKLTKKARRFENLDSIDTHFHGENEEDKRLLFICYEYQYRDIDRIDIENNDEILIYAYSEPYGKRELYLIVQPKKDLSDNEIETYIKQAKEKLDKVMEEKKQEDNKIIEKIEELLSKVNMKIKSIKGRYSGFIEIYTDSVVFNGSNLKQILKNVKKYVETYGKQSSKKQNVSKKAENEDLIEVGWDLFTNDEYEIKDNALYGDDKPQEVNEEFWNKINKEISDVESYFLKEGYKKFFTKVRDEGHGKDNEIGGTAWMTEQQLRDFMADAEQWDTEFVLSESSGVLDFGNIPVDYNEALFFRLSIFVDDKDLDKLGIEAKKAKKNKKQSSKTSKMHKKATKTLEEVARLIDTILDDYDHYDYVDQLEVGEKSHYESILADLQKDEKGIIESVFNRVSEDDDTFISDELDQLKEYYNNKFVGKKSFRSKAMHKRAGWKVLTPKDLTKEVKDEFLKDSIKEYAGHVKGEDFYLVKGVKEKEDDQFSYDWEEGMFGEWRSNVKGEIWYSSSDFDNWDYIYLIKEDKLYKMPNRDSLTDFGVVSSKKVRVQKKAKIVLEQINNEYFLNGKKGDYSDFNNDGKYKQISYNIFVDKDGKTHKVWEFAGYLDKKAGNKEQVAEEYVKKYYRHEMDLEDLHSVLYKLFGTYKEAVTWLAENDERIKMSAKKAKRVNKQAKIELIENVWYKIFGYPLSLKYLGKGKGGMKRFERADGTEVIFDADVEVEPYEYSYSPFKNVKKANEQYPQYLVEVGKKGYGLVYDESAIHEFEDEKEAREFYYALKKKIKPNQYVVMSRLIESTGDYTYEELLNSELDDDIDVSSQKTIKQATIKHENGVYNVYSESGKCLGKGYKTKEEAEKRLKQVEYFKHKNATRTTLRDVVQKVAATIQK